MIALFHKQRIEWQTSRASINMIQKPEEIEKIKTAFKSLQSKKDLMLLLNLAKPMVYGAKSKPFHLKQLTYYANPKLGNDRYKEFKIKKKNGGERVINAPVAGLKSLQRTLSFIMQCVYQPHPAANGFVRSKSVVDNAKLHTGNKYVYNIDLKDFFTSIDQARVWKCLQLKPFSLTNERLVLANAIAAICCTKMEVERVNSAGILENIERNVLPQGAPTSPVLSNVICQRLDFLLSGLAKRFGLKYSRYADDITFSSQHNVYQKDCEFVVELNRIIIDQGFQIKESKTRLQKQGYRQEVTGIVVNEKVNVQKRYIKELRMWLYAWERYGYERANGFFVKQYLENKGHSKKGKPEMIKVIAGKLEYLKMVKGGESELYLKLSGRFEKLAGNRNPIDNLLAIWEIEGIDQAINAYYNKNTE